ncbi:MULTISPECIES: hypothetical protein [Parachlamydia]|uniref:hypothetical protein n=1 Tax=Parachlamydia TaxID=83551 RepID=UPI0001C17A48|nr:hypothetical protein [Parachlamydia acanthamoebae]EFB42452.1 hypothetical protein pah_c008o070 [Parachlamydia acanthamoebae str. Hall's coccus]
MNKKTFRKQLVFLIYLLMPFLAHAEMAIEYRTAAFFPSNHLFRHIYGDLGPNYQLEASKCVCSNVALWANTDLFIKHGRIRECGPSKVKLVNLSFGPKLIYPLSSRVNLYVGLGASIARICIKNKVHCESNSAYKMAAGGVFKSGMNFYLCQNLFLDVFIDYLYQPIHFHRTIDIGGIKVGAGIGTKF